MTTKRILLLGSTGSIGRSTLAVVDNLPEELSVVALAACRQWQTLLEQVRRYQPASVAMTEPAAAHDLERALDAAVLERRPRVYSGSGGLPAMVRETEGDIVVGAISGAAGLPANLAALQTGKDLALANKEAMVMTGALLTSTARAHGRRILPVDSEHSAIFQSLLSGRREEVHSLILTASGGPFRGASTEEMRRATKVQALKHPIWTNMGEKITIDSATLMNKALEIIEAHWLFEIPPGQIRVLIHPEAIVHSLVEFKDGSLVCQLAPPDMKIPIQYALTCPRRHPLPGPKLRLEKVAALTFALPDPVRFPALRLAYEVLEEGGTAPAVFNAANEVAVAAFLRDEIPFPEILGTVERTLLAHRGSEHARKGGAGPGDPGYPRLEDIFAADHWAREESTRQLQKGQLTRC